MFLKLPDWQYCSVERPSATIRAHMKHRMAAAKACGMEARMAPTFPIKQSSRKNFVTYLCKSVKPMPVTIII